MVQAKKKSPFLHLLFHPISALFIPGKYYWLSLARCSTFFSHQKSSWLHFFFSTSIFPAQDGKLLNISVQKSVRAFSFYLRKTIKFQEMHLLWECLISPGVFWKQKLHEKTSLNFCSMKCFPWNHLSYKQWKVITFFSLPWPPGNSASLSGPSYLGLF